MTNTKDDMAAVSIRAKIATQAVEMYGEELPPEAKANLLLAVYEDLRTLDSLRIIDSSIESEQNGALDRLTKLLSTTYKAQTGKDLYPPAVRTPPPPLPPKCEHIYGLGKCEICHQPKPPE